MIRVRFAPAPSGPLYASAARIALANFLFARRHGGEMILRLDDLDIERCRPEHAEQIVRDLAWLGIVPDSTIRQSERLPIYQEAIERLKRDGFLYPCFESPQELKAKEEFRRKRNQPTAYDRAMLRMTPQQREAAEAGGKVPYWRFKLSGRTLEWRDMLQGPAEATLAGVSDPVVANADGTPSALFASVVDDLACGITHILRSENNGGATAVQLELFGVLAGKAPLPRIGHLPGLDDGGKAVPAAQRVGSLSIRGLRNDGVEPATLITCMTAGKRDNPELVSLEELAAKFELMSLGSTRFDALRILAVNRRALQSLDFSAVAERLPAGATEAFWLAVRGHLDLLKEARGWWDVVAGTIVPPLIEGGRAVLDAAKATLPPEPWDGAVWADWITALQEATGLSEEALAEPLRLALTGEDDGPGLDALLPLMGRERVLNRLRIAAA